MLIPYEWLADKFIKSHEKKLKNSAAYRICTIIGAGIVLPVIAILLAIAIPTGYPDTAIICCAGSVIALGIFVFPLFDNKINYQGYLALVGFISMASYLCIAAIYTVEGNDYSKKNRVRDCM